MEIRVREETRTQGLVKKLNPRFSVSKIHIDHPHVKEFIDQI
jgi:hypothetical protein